MYVSKKRPKTVGGKPYPCYRSRDGNMVRLGSGMVSSVYLHKNECNNNSTCQCRECKNSPTPKCQFAEIEIQTAAHLVYSKTEAAHTTCHLFFDDGFTPEACSDVVTFTDTPTVWKDNVRDICLMKYFTHDLRLADKLDKMVKRWSQLKWDIYGKFIDQGLGRRESSSTAGEQDGAYNGLTIIVSHPHGCSNYVSIGSCVDTATRNSGLQNDAFKYTTATCPGCSGANVFLLVAYSIPSFNHFVHCGHCDGNKNMNFCKAL
jgi:hypothetical protein